MYKGFKTISHQLKLFFLDWLNSSGFRVLQFHIIPFISNVGIDALGTLKTKSIDKP